MPLAQHGQGGAQVEPDLGAPAVLAGGLRTADPGDDALMRGEGTGFCFEHPTTQGLLWALDRAVRMYRHAPPAWARLRDNGMRRDSSWAQSAATYLELYQALLRR